MGGLQLSKVVVRSLIVAVLGWGSVVAHAEVLRPEIRGEQLSQICSNLNLRDQTVFIPSDSKTLGRCSRSGEFTLYHKGSDPLQLNGVFDHPLHIVAEQSAVVLENSTFKQQLSITAQQISVTGSVAIEGNLFLSANKGFVNGSKEAQARIELSQDAVIQSDSFSNFGVIQARHLTIQAKSILNANSSVTKGLTGIQFLGFSKAESFFSTLVSGGDLIFSGPGQSSILNYSSKLYANGVFSIDSGSLKSDSLVYARMGSFFNVRSLTTLSSANKIVSGKFFLKTRDLEAAPGSQITAHSLFKIVSAPEKGHSVGFSKFQLNGEFVYAFSDPKMFESRISRLDWIESQYSSQVIDSRLNSVFDQFPRYSGLSIVSEVPLKSDQGRIFSDSGVLLHGGKKVQWKGYITNAPPEYKQAQVVIDAFSVKLDAHIQSTQNVILTAREELSLTGKALSDQDATLTAKAIEFSKSSQLSGKRILVQADQLVHSGEVVASQNVRLDAPKIQIAGTVVAESGCVSIANSISNDAWVCERLDILSDAQIHGARTLVKAKDMILEGSVSGEQGLKVEWTHYNPAFRGSLSTQGQFSIQGNISSSQALDLISSGNSGRITMNEVSVETSQNVTLDRDLDVPHGIQVIAPAIQLEENRKMKSQSGAIQLKAYAGSIEMQAGSQLDTNGRVLLDAAGDIRTKAVTLKGSSIQLKAEGNVIDEARFIDTHHVSEAPGFREERNERKAQVSQFQASGILSMIAQSIRLQGTRAEADAIRLEAKDQLAVMGVQETYASTRKTEEDTGWWFWSGKKVETRSESKSEFVAPELKAQSGVSMKAQKVTLEAPKLDTPETSIDSENLRILQGKNVFNQAESKKSENAFWISQEVDQRKDESHTQMSVLGKIKIQANQLELEQVQDQTLKYLDQLEYDPEKLELVRTLLDEIHTHEHDSISVPGPALIAAVAIAASVATGGVGGAAVAGLGLQAAGGLVASATAAALSSLSAQIVTQLTIGILAQQSPGDIMGKVFSLDTLKSMATATISAGALYEVGGLQNAAGTCGPLRHLENAGVQACVGITADIAFEDKSFCDALKSGGVQFAGQFVGSTAAGEIGDHFKDKPGIGDRILHKAAHGISAGGVAAGCAALTGQDVTAAAAAGAAGAMTAEVVADILSKPLSEEVYKDVQSQQAQLGRELTQDEKKAIFSAKVENIALISKLSGAVSGLLTAGEQGLNAGNKYAGNAIDQNFWVTAVPVLFTGYMLYEWERSNVETDDAIVSDPLGETVLLGGAAAGVKAMAKGAQKLAPALSQAEKGLVQVVQESEIIGNEVGAVGEISGLEARKISDSVGGAARNRAAFERYTRDLREVMQRPHAENPDLVRILDRQYRPNAIVGSGSTAAAIRYERATGELVRGRSHIQKGFEDLGSLREWLQNNSTARLGDRAAAENVIRDLEDALRGISQ